MVLVGHRKEGEKHFLLLQNWWKGKQFVEVDLTYLKSCMGSIDFIQAHQTHIPERFVCNSGKYYESDKRITILRDARESATSRLRTKAQIQAANIVREEIRRSAVSRENLLLLLLQQYGQKDHTLRSTIVSQLGHPRRRWRFLNGIPFGHRVTSFAAGDQGILHASVSSATVHTVEDFEREASQIRNEREGSPSERRTKAQIQAANVNDIRRQRDQLVKHADTKDHVSCFSCSRVSNTKNT